MLPGKARLSKSRGFKTVYSRGRSYATDLIVLYVLPRPGRARIRLGFAVGRKIGGAVRRNRAKRLMREAARLLLPRISGSLDAVVIGKRAMAEAAFRDVYAHLEKLLGRAGVLSDAEE